MDENNQKTIACALTDDDLLALSVFKSKYPTWWWKLGWCNITRDFDCAPQSDSPEIGYIKSGVWPDDVFSADSRGTFADAINEVMADIQREIEKANKNGQ